MCTYRNRKEVLLIRLLPNDVTRRAVSAGQNIISTRTGVSTTDRGRVPPDHLRVMKRLTRRFAVIIVLLGYPSTEHFLDRSYCSISRVAQVNVFTLSVPVGIVGVLLVDIAERRQMFGPSLGIICELVAPNERRNSNCGALAVMHVQDALGHFRTHISGIDSRLLLRLLSKSSIVSRLLL